MASEEFLVVLKSIDATLKTLLELSRQRTARTSNGNGGHAPEIASDRDLDGKYGNPIIKLRDPRDWSGPTMKGRRLSDCPADYLDLYAERQDYFAMTSERDGKLTNGGKPAAQFERLNAARARGWAARIRAGKHTPTPVDAAPGWSVTDDDEPAPSY